MIREPVDLGFAERCAPRLLTSAYFPSKIGGEPAWLDPMRLPLSTELMCPVCKLPMVFLMQLYAPDVDEQQAFHRTIFIFCCKSGACHKKVGEHVASCFKVLRCQLPKNNSYYPSEPVDEDDIDHPVVNKWQSHRKVTLCQLCGIPGDKCCSVCKTRYCSKEHQTLDWQWGHQKHCSSLAGGREVSFQRPFSVLFPELEIVSEPEEPAALDSASVDAKENAQALVLGGEQEEPFDASLVTKSDKHFLRFQKRIAPEPNQILRYARVDGRDRGTTPSPLFASDLGQIEPEKIASCSLCGRKREFEFQILPQMLNYLGVDDTQKDALDWGSLFVFTCPKSCPIDGANGSAYVAEQMFKQDFVEVPKTGKDARGSDAVSSDDEDERE